MNSIKSFSFLRSYVEAMEEMNEKEQKEFSWAIIQFVYYDKAPEFKGKLKIAWILIEPILIKSKNKSNPNQN